MAKQNAINNAVPGGLKDDNVTVAINLGDSSNTEFTTTNKTIVGSVNEINQETLKKDGSEQLTANWDAGAYKITAETLESDVTTGTAPFLVASQTKVTNLNADKVDGRDETEFALLAGRAGGQTIKGGVNTEDDLTFETTSHATKGRYIFSELTTLDGILRTDNAGSVTSSTDLPNGTTATTQSQGDSTTKLSTTAFSSNASNLTSGTIPDARIQSSGVTQHQANIDHNLLTNYQIGQHRIINDNSDSTIELFSANKINALFTSVSAGLILKENIDTSTENAGNISLTGEQTLNGLTTSLSRVLVMEQADATTNGIYITSSGAWTRATDLDESTEIITGVRVYCDNSSSSVFGVTYSSYDIDNTFVLGTDALNFQRGNDIQYGTTAGTATEGNDSRLPTQDENNALAGTNGTPSASNKFVTNTDPRNTNARTPVEHSLTGSEHTAVTLAELNSKITDATLIDTADSRLTNNRYPTSHAASHQNGGTDEIATATASANSIPKADINGKLDTWISDGSTTAKGKVELATDGEAISGVVVQGNDSRLSNSRQCNNSFDNVDTALTNLGLQLVLKDLTTAEINQLKNIDTTNISAAQWGYVGGLNQALSASSSPSFAGMTFTDNIIASNSQKTLTIFDNDAAAFSFDAAGKPGLLVLDTTDAIEGVKIGGYLNIGATTAITAILDEDDFASNSASALATQQSTKAYIDASVVGILDLKGAYDASTNTPDLDISPSGVKKGDVYVVSVAGTFFTEAVEVGDVITAQIDDATTLEDWIVVNKNLDQATTTTVGFVELATTAEIDAETDATRAITPATLAASALKTKLNGIEANADVTDAANVDAAGAVMNTDTSTASMSFVIDEDNFASNSNTKVPTQQSTKAYVDTNRGMYRVNVTGTSQTLATNSKYIANNAGLVTLTLPTTAAVGEEFVVFGAGAGGWKIAQNAGQSIVIHENSATTAGSGGYLESTDQYDAVTLICITANTTFSAVIQKGNPNPA